MPCQDRWGSCVHGVKSRVREPGSYQVGGSAGCHPSPYCSTLHHLDSLCFGLWLLWNEGEDLFQASGFTSEVERGWGWDIYSPGFLPAGSLWIGFVPPLKAMFPLGELPLFSYFLRPGAVSFPCHLRSGRGKLLSLVLGYYTLLYLALLMSQLTVQSSVSQASDWVN